MMAALMNPVRLEQHQATEQAGTEQALARRFWAVGADGRRLTAPPTYSVSVTLADGTHKVWLRTGGHTLDHTLEALDLYGPHCAVRVRKIGGIS